MFKNILSCSQEDFLNIIEEVLKKGNFVRLKVKGECMWPAIGPGDVITVSPAGEINSGDIIIYRGKLNAAFVHRVVGKFNKDGKEIILTKSDSAPDLDNPVTMEQILGKVTKVKKRFPIRYILSRALHRIPRI